MAKVRGRGRSMQACLHLNTTILHSQIEQTTVFVTAFALAMTCIYSITPVSPCWYDPTVQVRQGE